LIFTNFGTVTGEIFPRRVASVMHYNCAHMFFRMCLFGIACLLAVALSLVGCMAQPVSLTLTSLPTATPMPLNSLTTIADDMRLPHDARPHGVSSSVDWANAPRTGYGNHPPAGWTAAIPWGQVYEPIDGNPAVNTRVALRNMYMYVLSKKTGQWQLVQGSKKVSGDAFREDFADNLTSPADIRLEPDGSLSVKPGGGYNFHFWTSTGRGLIDAEDIAGVFTTVQARLVLEDPAGADDLSQARFLLSMGADYWQSLGAEWDYWKTNGDVAIARFKWVTPDWQAFNMTTLTLGELEQNPPPLQ
jgi:hypothetical protein